MAYLFLKDLHSVLRWFVILSCFWALWRVWGGLAARSAWTKQDRLAGLVFTSILNVQFLIGVVLYGISPITRSAMMNFGAAMKDSTLRFFAVEHPLMMLLAVIIAQAGFSMAKRAVDDRAKFRKATIMYTLSAVFILASIPWPFLKHGRPLLPSFLG
jgi:hypothetical protein